MKIFKVDRLVVRVAVDRAALGLAAAEAVCGAIGEVLGRKEAGRGSAAEGSAAEGSVAERSWTEGSAVGGLANVMFASAPSQNEFLAALVRMPVDWSRVNGFHMDEYMGLAEDAPQGFGNFLRERLVGRVSMRSFSFMRTIQEYAHKLAREPMDIVVLGIGENTHLAFNDPHAALFDDPELVKVVELDEACRAQQVGEVGDGCFGALEEVPRRAMTVTIPGLMRAEYIFGVVPGARKAEAVRRTLYEEVSERYPATVLRRHARAILFLDGDSAGKLGLGGGT
jgi:glucosamine-6-phosphate deaminase